MLACYDFDMGKKIEVNQSGSKGLFGSDSGKAVWARQRLQASGFTRLRLDGPAWRRQILQGTNQRSPDASADRTWLARLT